RNTDVQLRPREELLGTYRALQLAVKQPEDFIAMVFGTSNRIWVERLQLGERELPRALGAD
ncbi:hypothetical protein CPLU01_16104, partial [Colletotrichum plurivorum]